MKWKVSWSVTNPHSRDIYKIHFSLISLVLQCQTKIQRESNLCFQEYYILGEIKMDKYLPIQLFSRPTTLQLWKGAEKSNLETLIYTSDTSNSC